MSNNFDGGTVCRFNCAGLDDDEKKVSEYLDRVGAWKLGKISRPTREQYQEAWADFVSSGEPYCVMMTVPIHVRLGDRKSYKVLRDIVRRMNSVLFSRRGKKRGVWLEGFFVGEQYRLHKKLRGQLHWHVLIRQRADAPPLSAEAVLVAFRQAVDWINRSAKKEITSIDENQSVKPIYDEAGVIKYTQKELERFDCEFGDQFGFLCSDGLSGFCLENSRKKLTG